MMKRSKIATLLSEGRPRPDVLVQGWVRTRRGSKKVNFIELNDGSTGRKLRVLAVRNSWY